MSDADYHLAFEFIAQEPEAAARLLEIQDLDQILPFLINTPSRDVALLLRNMQAEYAANLLLSAETNVAQEWMGYLNADNSVAYCAASKSLSKTPY